MSAYHTIALDLAAPVAQLRLNNPPANVITLGMMDELRAALEQVEQQPKISVLVISGEGRGFSAGVDVAAHTPEKIQQMLGGFHSVIRTLVSSKKVTVAQVHGNCLGGGAELAVVCDLVYTARDARWGFPEIKLGCFPPVAAIALAALVGQKRAADLILSGRQITGAEALAIGLANGAVNEKELTHTVEEAIARFAELSPSSLAVTKKALYAWDAIHFDKGLARAEQIYLESLMKTEDAREGIAAFLEKRPPRWSGK